MKRALVVSLVVLGAVASGCGDDGDASGSSTATTTSQAPSADAGTDTGGDGDGDGALPRFCDLLTPEQVAGAVGAPVTLTTGPFDACEFDQEDPRALSGSLGVVEVGTDNGGFESYRSSASSGLTGGADHPVEVGDGDAFVATGTIGGGESIHAAGGVLTDGGRVLTVNLSQAAGMTADQLVAISTRLLQLLADAT